MQYEELTRRYGSFVSQRLRAALTPSEFEEIDIDYLHAWLAAKAENAHENYRHLLSHPFAAPEDDIHSTGQACRQWREIEDLSYVIAIAETGTPARVG